MNNVWFICIIIIHHPSHCQPGQNKVFVTYMIECLGKGVDIFCFCGISFINVVHFTTTPHSKLILILPSHAPNLLLPVWRFDRQHQVHMQILILDIQDLLHIHFYAQPHKYFSGLFSTIHVMLWFEIACMSRCSMFECMCHASVRLEAHFQKYYLTKL